MLSNCALAAAASTSRLLCTRRTFASLVPGSDSSEHEPPVLPSLPKAPKVSISTLEDPNLERRIKKIIGSVQLRNRLSFKQVQLLDSLGLVSPTSESVISRKLAAKHLNSLRDFFAAYSQARTVQDLPEFEVKLGQALRNAVTRAFRTDVTKEPSSSGGPVKVLEAATERRGRIKPVVTSHRKWDAPESLSPLALSQLRERSRHDLVSLKGNVLTDIDPVNEMRPIARLVHGLDRALFNPGVNWLQDPRSRVYNYDPWLQKIPNVRDFAFERLPGFIKSSRDEDLWNLCRREGRQFAGSTSSLSGLLCHIYFLLSRDRRVDLSTLSRQMDVFPDTFTPGQRMPAAVILRHRDGVYATDSDSYLPGSAETNVLSWMGTMLEKFLTTDATTFSRYMRDSTDPPEPDTDTRREAYRYSMSPKMVMRSQLDAVDPRLPGRGVFDIKTRAAMSVRYDSKNWVENAGYLIRQLHGVTESFEREYCDLIRAAFLKYSFQARIGAMDGVMVAYHNTARVFGFQYIPLEEMDARLYGAPERGERVFNKCVQVLELVLETATGAFPGKSVRILSEKYEQDGFLRFFVEPMPDEEADAEITANEQAEREDAVQLGEGVDPSEIVSRRIQKAKQAADAEEKKRAPIKMFTVQISHVVDGKYVSADAAINDVERDWNLKVTIERPALDDVELRKMRAEIRKRQFRANFLPSGVSVKQMEKQWEKEARINSASQGPVPAFDPKHWTKPDWKTEAVRELSRKGAEEQRRLDELDKEMGHEHLVPNWVQASGVSLPEVEPPVDVDEALSRSGDTELSSEEVLLPVPPSLKAEQTEQASLKPRVRKGKRDLGDTTKVPHAPTLEEGGGELPAEDVEKVTERMHEMPHVPKGEASTHEWDERDNLHRVDTVMDKGTRPSPSHSSSVKEWEADEEKPLPGTKAANDEEKA